MAGFFGKQQYAAIADMALTKKLSKHLCLECSTCAMFFNSSLIVSMIEWHTIYALSWVRVFSLVGLQLFPLGVAKKSFSDSEFRIQFSERPP